MPPPKQPPCCGVDLDAQMSDCYRACDDSPYEDSFSPPLPAGGGGGGGGAAAAAPRFIPLVPNKWHAPPMESRSSEILCYLPEIAEHDTLRGVYRAPNVIITFCFESLAFTQVMSRQSSTTATTSRPSSKWPSAYQNCNIVHPPIKTVTLCTRLSKL